MNNIMCHIKQKQYYSKEIMKEKLQLKLLYFYRGREINFLKKIKIIINAIERPLLSQVHHFAEAILE